ncbi:MAG: 50S ribosomal protein L21 [Candidatus Komeilibacteria bacterium]|jgi:large subunit ribosomal protein L21|nr:50S ribosomal protein L21 [Candidatus Komeilibacteria bacterium]MBT4447832.1 50S ribosomal protein L21 [Candidatus Komeilibacteria bacterium]
MKAVIKTGGKQYQVAKGDTIKIEKLPEAEEGKKVVFDTVLLLMDKDKVTVGNPTVAKAKVEGTLVRNFKDKKIDILKYKNKTRYRKHYGHRQQLAEVKITSIVA